MAQTYDQLQKRIEQLQERAAKLREKEVEGVVERIRVAIAHYQLTPEQLFGDNRSTVRRRAGAVAAKFKDEHGHTWSGRGKRPNWLRQALDEGRALEDFQVAGSAVAVAGPKNRAAPRQRTAKASYSDEMGNTWSGFGPRPKWLKDAIAAGRSEESLRV